MYYISLSDGTKIEVRGHDDNESTRYAGSLVHNDGTFESTGFGSRCIVATSGGMETRYFLTDHLGSVRQVVAADGSVIEQNDYYPFGKEWAQPDMPTSDNRYTFSGKEKRHLRFQKIDYTDFGARFYDAEGVHFLQQDPLLEKYFRIGQYNFAREI